MIMVSPVPSRRARAAVADTMEIIDGLFDCWRDALLTSPFGKPGFIAWNVVSGPVTPNAARGVLVVAERSETACGRERADLFEWRRKIFSVAGEAARNWRSVDEGRRGQTHGSSPNAVLVLIRRETKQQCSRALDPGMAA